jgi:hypothetical protein
MSYKMVRSNVPLDESVSLHDLEHLMNHVSVVGSSMMNNSVKFMNQMHVSYHSVLGTNIHHFIHMTF